MARIKITEKELKNIVSETVKKVLSENLYYDVSPHDYYERVNGRGITGNDIAAKNYERDMQHREMERQRNLKDIEDNHKRRLAAQTAAEDAEREKRKKKHDAYFDALRKYEKSNFKFFRKKPKLNDFGL